MKLAFTDSGVRALKAPATGQVTVWDSVSPLGVRVSQGGSKTFVVMIGSGRRHTIGRVGVVKLAAAREEARRVLAQKTLGLIAPKIEELIFEEALRLFIDENYRGKKPRSKKEAKRLLEKHFVPSLGKKALPVVTDADIGKVLGKLADRPSEQLHAFRAARAFLKWCSRPPRRYLKHSPLEGYEAPGSDKKGTRVLTDAELVSVWLACDGAFGDLIRLLILWGTRKGETARVEREWVADGVVTIDGAVTKNGRAHAIPLQPMAREVLARQLNNSRYFFEGREPHTHFADGSWGKRKRELVKVSGVKGWQVRDLRRTFRSKMAKLKVPRDICENLLNHVTGTKNELDEIYDKYDYLEEKADALAKWEAYLSNLLARA